MVRFNLTGWSRRTLGAELDPVLASLVGWRGDLRGLSDHFFVARVEWHRFWNVGIVQGSGSNFVSLDHDARSADRSGCDNLFAELVVGGFVSQAETTFDPRRKNERTGELEQVAGEKMMSLAGSSKICDRDFDL